MVAKSNKHYNETLLFGWLRRQPDNLINCSCRVQMHCGPAHQFQSVLRGPTNKLIRLDWRTNK